MNGWGRAIGLGFALLLSGCGESEKFAAVTGRVTIDGQPLVNVLVTFVPDAASGDAPVRSMGLTDAAGEFQLKSETQRIGAVLGAHRVIVEDMAIHAAPRDADGTVFAIPPLRFPKHYSDIVGSPLTAHVASDCRVELNLESGRP